MATKEEWLAYLELLKKIGETLEGLTALEEEKILAVTKGDLPTVDEIMKKEQAFSMTLRGYEQKRGKLLGTLGVSSVKLGDLSDELPEEVRVYGKRIINQLKTRYEGYKIASNLARINLEAGLDQLETLTGQKVEYKKAAVKTEPVARRDMNGAPLKTMSPEMKKLMEMKIQERGQLSALENIATETVEDSAEGALRQGLLRQESTVSQVSSKVFEAARRQEVSADEVEKKKALAERLTQEKKVKVSEAEERALAEKALADRKALQAKAVADRKALSEKKTADRKALAEKAAADKKALQAKYEADKKALADKAAGVTGEVVKEKKFSKLSQFIRKKKPVETEVAAVSVSEEMEETGTEGTLEKSENKRTTATMPPKEVVNSLRKSKEEEALGGKKSGTVGNTKLNVGQEVLKNQQQKSETVSKSTTFRA